MDDKILILRTGEPPRQVRERHGSYEQAIINALGGEGKFVVVDARKEPLPEPVYKGIIITGSAASAYHEDEWIRQSEDFLRQAADRGVAIYGICFGHQLLAQAFGGRVEKCPKGWELGTASISLCDEALQDSLFTGLPEEFPAQQSHGDVVVELPAGAVQLASNAHWPIQAFRLGEKIWGTQFHPEFTVGLIGGLVDVLTTSLPAESFPALRGAQSIRERIHAGLRDTPQARSCLRNFLRFLAVS
ncbi:MAG TPA: glutamine amidotransferase [Methylomirabilota bacterium]|jgi:GMP synthase (glutamine-hydrolysing)|nr:glutamine amidotransferase [Methylomirabilota bacterium]